MKRRAFKLVLFLLLGAIVNVAVAWVCCARFDAYPGNMYPMAQADIDELCDRYAPSHISRQIEIAVEMTLFSLTHQELGGDVVDIYYHEAGFPVRSLRGALMTMDGRGTFCGMLEVAWPFSFLDRCPTREFVYAPIWPGFAINTLFYAGILWLLFAAPFALRRRRRVKRGLCPSCGYPAGESDVCTECGNQLPSPSR